MWPHMRRYVRSVIDDCFLHPLVRCLQWKGRLQ